MPKPAVVSFELVSSELYVGVDPGLSGALVCLSDRSIIACTKTPITERDILDWFKQFPLGTPALIEWINPGYRGSGKSSMSKLYGSYKELRMALTASDMSWQDVKPGEWQQGLRIPPKTKAEKENQNKWKNKLKGKAQQLFPQEKVTLATADALLIAEYCRRTHR